jgi:putative acetyltransferase
MSDGHISVRPERLGDEPAVRAVNEAAFDTPAEATLVDVLRGEPGCISLVAEWEGKVAGHIQFSPAVLESETGRWPIGALGPMAVLPELQRRGIGSQLVRAGLTACRAAGRDAVIVLGHPDFYPRFGFVPADDYGVRSESEVPREVFMVLELRPGSLRNRAGLARYHPAFAGV